MMDNGEICCSSLMWLNRSPDILLFLFQKPYKEAITMNTNIYPRTNDLQTVYLNAVINNPHIKVGDYTIYNDFVN